MDHKISYGLARARTTLSLMALVLRCSNSVQTSHVSPQVDQKADSERRIQIAGKWNESGWVGYNFPILRDGRDRLFGDDQRFSGLDDK